MEASRLTAIPRAGWLVHRGKATCKGFPATDFKFMAISLQVKTRRHALWLKRDRRTEKGPSDVGYLVSPLS